jgi:hypothetical protein
MYIMCQLKTRKFVKYILKQWKPAFQNSLSKTEHGSQFSNFLVQLLTFIWVKWSPKTINDSLEVTGSMNATNCSAALLNFTTDILAGLFLVKGAPCTSRMYSSSFDLYPLDAK